ncbi:hypothetical protein D3C72_2427270 [compost metagenome]
MPDRMSISAMKPPNGGNPSKAKMPTVNSSPEKGKTRITPLSALISWVPYTARKRPAVRNSSDLTKALLTT